MARSQTVPSAAHTRSSSASAMRRIVATEPLRLPLSMSWSCTRCSPDRRARSDAGYPRHSRTTVTGFTPTIMRPRTSCGVPSLPVATARSKAVRSAKIFRHLEQSLVLAVGDGHHVVHVWPPRLNRKLRREARRLARREPRQSPTVRGSARRARKWPRWRNRQPPKRRQPTLLAEEQAASFSSTVIVVPGCTAQVLVEQYSAIF